MNFDTEKFIEEIKKRKAIWHCEGPIHKNRDLRRKHWDELSDIFGKEGMTKEEKKYIGKELHKKWKNIRDNFVKTLKDHVTGCGSKKSQYIFFNNLMFLKDSVYIHGSEFNKREYTRKELEKINDPLFIAPPPKKTRKRKKQDEKQQESENSNRVNDSNKNVQLKTLEEDEDRHFFLSLVSEIKKVPEHLRLQTKSQIMQVLIDAQPSGYCNSGNYVLPNNESPTEEHQAPSLDRNGNQPSPSTLPPNRGSPPWKQEPVASPDSMDSQTSQGSDYLDLFLSSDSQ